MITQIITDAVTIEKESPTDSLPVRLIGMNAELMGQSHQVPWLTTGSLYWAVLKIYKVENPFSFMDFISMQGKTNFFEHRVSEYQKADMTGGFSIDGIFNI